jgi:pSer/pThr/pTyr-binding forkhead associated (FHA) protein
MDEISAFQDKTVAMASPIEQILGPKLVLSTLYSEDKIFPLDTDYFIIGRSPESQVQLEDASVSRQHCLIEKRENMFWAKNLSATNPLMVNDEQVSEKPLYSGDQLRIGSFSLAYLSDRPEDAKPVGDVLIDRQKGPGWPLWLAAAGLLLILGIYAFYGQAYKPWKIRRTINFISQQIISGDYQPAKNRLIDLLKTDLTPEQTHETMELLSEATVAIANNMAEDGGLTEAKNYLMQHLLEYGAGDEAGVLWDRLDFYRIKMGQRLESGGDYQAALSQYGAVREDSLFYNEAQRAVKRIWLAYQQQQRQDQTLSQLVEEAEAHFQAKRYLTPINQNSYSVYQAVLALEPENALALKRIEQIKEYYRQYGEKYFAKEDWIKALAYFERYSIIDPEAEDINRKIDLCRQKLTTPKSSSRKPKTRKVSSKETTDAQREKIKRMLEESGAESKWILKYLFEEQGGEKNAEKPW